MRDIDDMDMIGFLKVRAYKARQEKEARKGYIDQIWKDL